MKSSYFSFLTNDFHLQKQPIRGVLIKRCSENMQQIYRRTPNLKHDFNKVALQISLLHGCSPVNLLCYIFSEHLNLLCYIFLEHLNLLCYIFLEQLFLRTLVDGYFCILWLASIFIKKNQ